MFLYNFDLKNASFRSMMIRNRLFSFFLVAITFSVGTSFAQNIPDEINYQPYYQKYLASKTVSDQKRTAANQAQSDLSSAQTQLQNTIDAINANSSQLNQYQSNSDQLALANQSLLNQNDTNTAVVYRNQQVIDQNVRQQNELDRRLREYMGRIEKAEKRERPRLEDLLRQRTKDDEVWQARLKNADDDLRIARKNQDENSALVRTSKQQKEAEQNNLLKLTQNRATTEQAIQNSQNSIEPLKKQVQDLSPKVDQKANDLAASQTQQKTVQATFNQDQATLAKITAQKEPLTTSLKAITAQVDSQKQLLEQQKTQLKNNKQDLANAQTAIQTQTDKKSDLLKRQKESQQKQDSAKTDLATKTIERDKDQKLIADKNQQLGQIPRGQANDPKAVALRKEIADLNLAVTALNKAISDDNSAIASTTNDLNSISSDLSKTNTELTRLQDLVAKGPAGIDALQKKVDDSQVKLTGLVQQQANISTQVDALAPAEQNANVKLRESKNAYDSVTAQVNTQQAALQSLKDQLKTAQASLASAQNGVTQNQTNLTKIKADLTASATHIDQLTRVISDAEQKAPALAANTKTYENAKQSVVGNAQASADQVRQARDDLNNLNHSIEELKEAKRNNDRAFDELGRQNSTLVANNQDLNYQIQNNNKVVGENQRAIADYSRAILALQTKADSLNQNRTLASTQVANAQTQFDNINQIALQAEVNTQTVLQAYSTRKQEYDAELADAVAAGSSAGSSQGQQDGDAEGQQAGLTQGKTDGALQGQSEGKIDGFNRGKSDGESSGFAEGQAKGSASDADYQKGLKEGDVLGRADAALEATRVDYPRGKQDQFNTLTSTLPANVISLDQESTQKLVNAKGQGSLKDSISSVMKVIHLTQADACTQNFSDFLKACKKAYQKSYAQARQDAYTAGVKVTYQGAFDAARADQFELHKNDRFKEGHDLTYTVSFQKGLASGKDSAYQRGITEARASGFQAVRQGLGDTAYAKGKNDQAQYFNSHSVTLMKTAKLIRVGEDGSVDGNVGPSDYLKLQLVVANFGAKNSDPHTLKVEMKALTSGIEVRQNWVQLITIPANTVATVSNVLTAKVLETTNAGSNEQLQINFTDELGNKTTTILAVNITPDLQLEFKDVSYNNSPRLGKTQTMKVSIGNNGNQDSFASLVVGISSSVSKEVLRLDVAEITMDPLSAGDHTKVKGLSYTVLDANALAQGIPMTVYVKHGGRTVLKQTLQLRR